MKKKICISIGIFVIIFIIVGIITKSNNIKEIQQGETSDNSIISNEINNNQNKENINGDKFNAKIKKISEYNGRVTILVEGLETNDINHKGKYDFSIDDDTKILWINPKSIKSSYTELNVSNLKEGQNVSITSTGSVLESYPAKLTKVTKVILLENEL